MKEEQLPLVVDLDGTLIRTDSLWEGFYCLLSTKPWLIILLPFWLIRGKVHLKAMLAEYCMPGMPYWPFTESVLAYVRQAKQDGRPVYLATAAHESVARAICSQCGFFDGFFASSAEKNLKGKNKKALLIEQFGEKGFDYIGDSKADIPVWAACDKAFVVAGRRRLPQKVALFNGATNTFHAGQPTIRAYLRALRVYQWVKNSLIFAPMLLAHQFTVTSFTSAALAFLSFSCTASSVYILNDLLDLCSDRQHPQKRKRPFASGLIPLSHGIPLTILFLGAGVVVALKLSLAFFACLGAYYCLTLAYSFWIKRQLILDIISLACLYSLRLFAGGVAVGVSLSNWLLSFSLFLFLGLALVKRAAELTLKKKQGQTDAKGRAYETRDYAIVENMAVSSGMCSILVLAQYVDSLQASQIYSRPNLLWLLCPLFFCVYGRLLIITHRGEMHHDPILFILRDTVSICSVIVGVAVFVLAS